MTRNQRKMQQKLSDVPKFLIRSPLDVTVVEPHPLKRRLHTCNLSSVSSIGGLCCIANFILNSYGACCNIQSMSDNWLSNSFTYAPNLEAYFARIGYDGSREPTAETLKQLQWHHLLTIPYEVLDVHLTGKIDLTPEVVERKIVTNGRGGYCYEHNTLFMYVLRTMGFDVTPIAARVRWQKPEDLMSSFIHLVLVVKIDNISWICDVGLSACGAPIPLAMEMDTEQPSPLETRRIIKLRDFYAHQMYSLGQWHNMFFFTLNRSYPVDWELGSYYFSTHHNALAVRNIMVSMPTTKCRYLLMNKVLTTRYMDGTVETREIATEEEYLELLRTTFKLNLPEGTRLCPPGMTW